MPVFFQAEDGIRDTSVTGVQTCALPIYLARGLQRVLVVQGVVVRHPADPAVDVGAAQRSEERRVGKECSTTGALKHYKKKKWPSTFCIRACMPATMSFYDRVEISDTLNL